MTRFAVFAAALVFILAFTALTIRSVATQGFSIEGALAMLMLVLLTIGILGALRNPPGG